MTKSKDKWHLSPVNRSYYEEKSLWEKIRPYVLGVVISAILLLLVSAAMAGTFMKASWYSIESLKKEGTYKYSKGVMANGKQFQDEALTCGTGFQYSLGTFIKITSINNGKSVVVKVTDRIGKRFRETRVDLSKSAFEKIANLREGVIPVEIKVLDKK